MKLSGIANRLPWVHGALRVLVTMLFFLVVNRSLTTAEVTGLLQEVSFFPLIAALFLGIAGFAFQVLRWELVLCFEGFPTTKDRALKTLLWGSLLAFVTPGRLGELVRGLSLDPARKSDSVLAVVVDRFYAIAITAVFGLAAMTYQAAVFGIAPSARLAIPMAVLIACAGLASVYIVFLHPHRVNGWTGRILNRAAKLIPRLHSVFGEKIIGYSVLAHCCLLLQTALLLDMFGAAGFAANMVVAAQAYAFMILLPFFIANVGLREYSFGLFLSQFGQREFSLENIQPVALGVSTMVLLINIVLPALFGLFWVLADYIRGNRNAIAAQNTR